MMCASALSCDAHATTVQSAWRAWCARRMYRDMCDALLHATALVPPNSPRQFKGMVQRAAKRARQWRVRVHKRAAHLLAHVDASPVGPAESRLLEYLSLHEAIATYKLNNASFDVAPLYARAYKLARTMHSPYTGPVNVF